MAQLIDTNIFIKMERRGASLSTLAAVTTDGQIAIAAISASELLVGMYRADSSERRLRREVYIEAILEWVPVLPFDLRVARVHAQIWSTLITTGQMIGANDLMIGATAIANGYSVLTENIQEFLRIPGLEVVAPDW